MDLVTFGDVVLIAFRTRGPMTMNNLKSMLEKSVWVHARCVPDEVEFRRQINSLVHSGSIAVRAHGANDDPVYYLTAKGANDTAQSEMRLTDAKNFAKSRIIAGTLPEIGATVVRELCECRSEDGMTITELRLHLHTVYPDREWDRATLHDVLKKLRVRRLVTAGVGRSRLPSTGGLRKEIPHQATDAGRAAVTHTSPEPVRTKS